TQVLVKQFASGVCHTQLHQLHDQQGRTPKLLGHESTGVVVAAGSRVSRAKEGDRVMLTFVPQPVDPGATRDLPVVKWRGHDIAGSGASSTWSEAVVTDQDFVVPLDSDVATDVTAIIGCAVMTGCGAVLNTAQVRPGDSVV